MLPPFHSVVCIAHVYQVTVHKKPPCSKLNEGFQDKSEINTNFTINQDPLQLNLKGRHVPPKRPYQCKPKCCYNTEESSLYLSSPVNTDMYMKEIKQESRRQSHCNSLYPVFIRCRQGVQCSALIQIYQVATYYVESVQTISV